MQTITLPFRPHEWQLKLWAGLKRFSVLACHRRFGKTVFSVNLAIRKAITSKLPNHRGYYVAPLYRQAKLVAWDYMRRYTEIIPGVQYNQAELRVDFPNKSRVMLLGADNPDSLRGPYLDDCVLDEYAYMRPNVWGEIIRPALADRKGTATFISTPQGHNHFYDIYQYAKSAEKDWAALMFKASETEILDPDELRGAAAEMTPEQYAQEFECSFEAAIMGAYYGRLLEQADADGRITGVPVDPVMKVHTAWDLGIRDAMAIWFAQVSPGGEIRLVDYYENTGEGLQHYVKMLAEKGYIYGSHLAPHDIKVRELGTGKSRLEVAASLGINFEVVPDIGRADGIDAVRSLLPRCWFDAKRTDKGIEALRQYRKEYSDRLSKFSDSPLHDWTSNGADAFRMLAVGISQIEQTAPIVKINPGYRGRDSWMM